MKLTITVEAGDIDPTLVDPHDIAEDVMDVYGGNAWYPLTLVSAEWQIWPTQTATERPAP